MTSILFYFSYTLVIVATTEDSSLPQLESNGFPIKADWQCVEAGYECSIMFTHLPVSQGHHTLTASEGTTFHAWHYGNAEKRSYAHSLGFAGKI